MSFVYGVNFAASVSSGKPMRSAHIKCDKCDTTKSIFNSYGYPFLWFLSNKSPKNWKTIFHKDVDEDNKKLYRIDYCLECKEKK